MRRTGGGDKGLVGNSEDLATWKPSCASLFLASVLEPSLRPACVIAVLALEPKQPKVRPALLLNRSYYQCRSLLAVVLSISRGALPGDVRLARGMIIC